MKLSVSALLGVVIPLLIAAAFVNAGDDDRHNHRHHHHGNNLILRDPAVLSYYTLAVVYTTGGDADPSSFRFDSLVYPPSEISCFHCGSNVTSSNMTSPFSNPFAATREAECGVAGCNDRRHFWDCPVGTVTLPPTCNASTSVVTTAIVRYFLVPVGSTIADIKIMIRATFGTILSETELDRYLLSLCPFDAFLPDYVVVPSCGDTSSCLSDAFGVCRYCCATVSPSLLPTPYDRLLFLRFAATPVALFNEAVNAFDVRAIKAVDKVERELCEVSILSEELKHFDDRIHAEIKRLRSDSSNWMHQAELVTLKYLEDVTVHLIHATQRAVLMAEDLLVKLLGEIEQIAVIAQDCATFSDIERVRILGDLLSDDIAHRREETALIEAICGIRSAFKALIIIDLELKNQLRIDIDEDSTDLTCSCNVTMICSLIDTLFPAPFGCRSERCIDVVTMTRIFANDVFLGLSCTTGLASRSSILHFLRDHFGSNAAILTIISDAVGSYIGRCGNQNEHQHDLLREIRLGFASVSAIEFLRVIHDRRHIAKLSSDDRVYWNQQWLAAAERWAISPQQFSTYFSQFLLPTSSYSSSSSSMSSY